MPPLAAPAHMPSVQEELLTAMHWQKQVTALIIGIVCGVLPLTGLNGFLTWVHLAS